MTTTHLFVELLVIGFGALAWILILIAALFGYDIGKFQAQILSLGAVFPTLGLAYVLGILTDRVADWIVDRVDIGHRRKVYEEVGKSQQDYFQDRRTLVVDGPELWKFFEYGRSRLRICRGWFLNSLLLTASTALLLVRNHGSLSWTQWQYGACFTGLVGFSWLCWRSWSRLNQKEYSKIERQAAWVLEQKKAEEVKQARLIGPLEIRLDLMTSSRKDADDSHP